MFWYYMRREGLWYLVCQNGQHNIELGPMQKRKARRIARLAWRLA